MTPGFRGEAGGTRVFGVPPPRCRGGQTATVLAEQPEEAGADSEVQAVMPAARSRPERGQRRGVRRPRDPPWQGRVYRETTGRGPYRPLRPRGPGRNHEPGGRGCSQGVTPLRGDGAPNPRRAALPPGR